MRNVAGVTVAIFTVVCLVVAAKAEGNNDAESILKKVAETYKSVKTYQDKTIRTRTSTIEGYDSYEQQYALFIERPNKLAFVCESGGWSRTRNILCDGKKVYTYMPWMRKYTEVDAPATLDELLEGEVGAQVLWRGYLAVVILFGKDPYKFIMNPQADQAELIGEEMLDGVRVYHLRVLHEGGMEIDVWVDVQSHLIRKARREMKFEGKLAEDYPHVRGKTVVYEERHEEIQIEAKIPAEVFSFAPPEGVERVESFFPRTSRREPREPDLELTPAPAGSEWEQVGPAFKHRIGGKITWDRFSYGIPGLLDMMLDSTGRLHIVFYDFLKGDYCYVTADKGAGLEENVDKAVLLGAACGIDVKLDIPETPSIIIRLDARNRPHILWGDSRLWHYMTLKGEEPGDGWVHAEVAPSDETMAKMWPKIAVSPAGVPYVLYFAVGGPEGRSWRLATKTGTSWDVATVPVWVGPRSDLSVGKHGEPMIAYCLTEQREVDLMTDWGYQLGLISKSGDKWIDEKITDQDFAATEAGFLRLLTDASGNPHVLFLTPRHDAAFEEFSRTGETWQGEVMVKRRRGMMLPGLYEFPAAVSGDGKFFLGYLRLTAAGYPKDTRGFHLVEKTGNEWQEHLLTQMDEVVGSAIAAPSSSEVLVALVTANKRERNLHWFSFKRVGNEGSDSQSR